MEKLLKKITPFSSLQYRDYRLFLSGFFISQMADRMIEIAIAWQLYQLTNSPASLGIIGIMQFLPLLLLSMFGGVTADKVERKRLLFVTQFTFSLAAIILTIFSLTGQITPLLIYVIVALIAAIRAFYGPVRQSIIPGLVPKGDLMNAITLNTLARQSAIVVGPALAGLLIALYGVQAVYLSASVAFLFMLITIIPIKVPAIEGKLASYDLKSIMEGINFVRKNRIISSTIMLDFFATFFGSATSLLPVFAAIILKTDAQGLGILYAATSVGGVLAGLGMSAVKQLKNQGMIIIVSIFIYGLATIGFGLSTVFWVSFVFLVIVGASDMVATILRNTIRQVLTPDHIRGRMVGINSLFAMGGPKLGDAEAGFLAALTSGPFSVVIGGVGTIIATIIIAATHPKLRKFDSTNITD